MFRPRNGKAGAHVLPPSVGAPGSGARGRAVRADLSDDPNLTPIFTSRPERPGRSSAFDIWSSGRLRGSVAGHRYIGGRPAQLRPDCQTGSMTGPRVLPLADRPLTDPHPDRLPADHPQRAAVLAAHAAALAAGDAGTWTRRAGCSC